MVDLEARDKARLIKEGLKIVDELADLEIDLFEGDGDLDDLAERAKKLKRDRNWKLT